MRIIKELPHSPKKYLFSDKLLILEFFLLKKIIQLVTRPTQNKLDEINFDRKINIILVSFPSISFLLYFNKSSTSNWNYPTSSPPFVEISSLFGNSLKRDSSIDTDSNEWMDRSSGMEKIMGSLEGLVAERAQCKTCQTSCDMEGAPMAIYRPDTSYPRSDLSPCYELTRRGHDPRCSFQAFFIPPPITKP